MHDIRSAESSQDTTGDIPEFLYRFRSAGALLGRFEELNKQHIYFASPEELNDPLEGYKDVFWTGDEILWGNLLRHYLLCLMNEMILAKLTVPGIALQEISFVRATEDGLATPELKGLYKRIVTLFREHPDVTGFVSSLVRRKKPIRSAELTTYFRLLHHHAMNSVMEVMEKNAPGMFRRASSDPLREASKHPLVCRQMSEGMEQAEHAEQPAPGLAEALGTAETLIGEQQFLLARYNSPDLFDKAEVWQRVFIEFPATYIRSLDQLMYSDWHTACFVKDPTQAAMWGNYADGHKGMCLQFRTSPRGSESPTLTLRQQNGYRSGKSGTEPVMGDVSHRLYKVQYQPKFVEIDFFRSLGTANRSMLEFWYRDEARNASQRVMDILAESEKWRNEYWENSAIATTTKLSDWAYEAEYRAVLHGAIIDFSDPTTRKLEFHFSDLEGIIFGARTSTADKLSVMKIVAEKCKAAGRTSFSFQQARFSNETGRFEIVRLSLLEQMLKEPTSASKSIEERTE